MLWTPTTILLHALWCWQFALSCAAEVLLLMAIATSYQNLWGAGREVPPTWAWVLFAVNGLLAVLVVAEICLYANSNLSPNLYLGLQTGKLAYATLIFVLFLAFSNMPKTDGLRDLFQEIIGILVFYTPWILNFVLAVLIKLTEKNSVKEEVTGSENAENSPERAPLLPAQIPGPKLPSQRMAVQRYPS
ncbi:hypothetical protein NA56DRAFT_650982 [Hyaloscypha hepaticicola]|uniref:Uncharacterized protein n=1 Tax=Hyaloscypha hepaticicola TaxID=2082293 RepID=A0A2J6PK98_9HELO|nr:hypothetical protein NA56DRAFT_650982 [Hyaloscypha hepaticicola]